MLYPTTMFINMHGPYQNKLIKQ